jgi:hypothetical protein
MTKNLDQFKLEERIRLSYLKNRGNILKVSEELDLDHEYVKKICKKIKKRQSRDVNTLISDTLAQQILIGYNQRTTYLQEMIEQAVRTEIIYRCPCEKKMMVDSKNIENTPEGVKQYRTGFFSSEATYYVLFYGYLSNYLERFKNLEILDKIVTRIYRNLEVINFCVETNYDLVSELFYSCETLKLFNCIETKEMIIHLAKYLFPKEIVEEILDIKEIGRTDAKFRHLRVNRITGETIYPS